MYSDKIKLRFLSWYRDAGKIEFNICFAKLLFCENCFDCKSCPLSKIFCFIMKIKAKIMDETTINRTMARITHEVLERNGGVSDLCIFGVKNRGVPLAKKLCDNIKLFENAEVVFGELDITMNRDDISSQEKLAKATDSVVPCDITNKKVLIVDDVLYTGRTAKAALETLFSYGRPKSVQLAVLIDRGHRELPIRPDYIGKNVPTSGTETVVVNLNSKEDAGVYICDKLTEDN